MRTSQRNVLSDLTLVAAFDAVYLKKLRCTWPTWMRFRPELLDVPVLLIYDGALDLTSLDLRFLEKHHNIEFVPWHMPGAASQREKMLTALVRIPATCVHTSWYLKLDADTYATQRSDWIDDAWFRPFDNSAAIAYVASPWGYTKPAGAIQILDDWADRVDGIRHCARLNLPVTPGSDLVRHSRMASWVFFGNTAWTRRITSLAPERLPIPSQDTYLSYCAARLASPVRHVRMKDFGWAHCSRSRALARACAIALETDCPTMTE